MGFRVTYNPTGAVGAAAFAAGEGKRRIEDRLEEQRRLEFQQQRGDRFSLTAMQIRAQQEAQARAAQFQAEAQQRELQGRMQVMQQQAAYGREEMAAKFAASQQNIQAQYDYNKQLQADKTARDMALMDHEFNLGLADYEARLDYEKRRQMAIGEVESYFKDRSFTEDRNWIMDPNNGLSDPQRQDALRQLVERQRNIRILPEKPTAQQQFEKDAIRMENGRIIVPNGSGGYTQFLPPKEPAPDTSNQFTAIDFNKTYLDVYRSMTTKDDLGVNLPTHEAVMQQMQQMQAGYGSIYGPQQQPPVGDGAMGGPLGQAAPVQAPQSSQQDQQLQAQMEAEVARKQFDDYVTRIKQAIVTPSSANLISLSPDRQRTAIRAVEQAVAVMNDPTASMEDRQMMWQYLQRASIFMGVGYE